jgi:hypothetical protein
MPCALPGPAEVASAGLVLGEITGLATPQAG